MIIKKESSKGVKFQINKNFIWVAASIILIVAIIFLVKKFPVDGPSQIETINVLFENGFDKIHGEFFDEEGRMKLKSNRSDETSKSGKYSIKVSEKAIFGPPFRIYNPNPGEMHTASIWRKTSAHSGYGYFAVQTEDPKKFYKNTNKASFSEGEWELLKLKFQIPSGYFPDYLEIVYYFTGKEGGEVYFDDLKIEKTELTEISNELEIPKIELYLDDKASRSLDQYAREGNRAGILSKEFKKFIPAKLIKDNEEHTVKIRLKGDWTDHIKGDEKSFRVKMKQDDSFMGLKEFSLMRPDRRGMIMEWLFHKVLEDEDILSTKYDFIYLKQNNKPYKAYVVEEHFAKQLVERNKRREGVILKWDEEALWASRNIQSKAGVSIFEGINIPFNSSQLLPFDETGVKGDSLKQIYVTEASSKMASFLEGANPEQIFDIEKFAKYFAIVELFNAHHSIIWHNIRFYYNPISKLIEPIGFDGTVGNAVFKEPSSICQGCNMNFYEFQHWLEFYKSLYKNQAFLELFIKYLKEYTSETYLEDIQLNYFNKISKLESYLKIDFPNYNFEFNPYLDRAKRLNLIFNAFNNSSLHCYNVNNNGQNKTVAITNNFNIPLEVVGSVKNIKDIETFDDFKTLLFKLNNPERGKKYFDTIVVPQQSNYILFRVPGQPEVYHSEIKSWESTPFVSLINRDSLSIPLAASNYSISSNKEIYIRPGDYQISQPFLVPKNYTLYIPEGTSVDLIKNAYILSYSPLNFVGSEESPIRFFSSDKTGKGITVMGCQERASSLQYVQILEQSNLNIDGYSLLGSVNFYESNVDIKQSEIGENRCEDALNIVRSEFNMTEVQIHHTFADGLDADFCRGTIKNSIFNNTGNDGTDFSGSYIVINDCIYRENGDKAVSAGEESTLKIKRISIDDAVIGLAAKDKSKVDINGIDIHKVNTAFTAFQKKPEYGGGSITVQNSNIKNANQVQLSDEKSTISIQ